MHTYGKSVKGKEGEKIDLIQSPYKASLSMLMKLNQIDSNFFPLPSTSLSDHEGLSHNSFVNQNILLYLTNITTNFKPKLKYSHIQFFYIVFINDCFIELPPNMVRAEFLMKATLQPVASIGIDRSEVPAPLKFSELSVSNELGSLLKEYKQKKESIHEGTFNSNFYLKLIIISNVL